MTPANEIILIKGLSDLIPKVQSLVDAANDNVARISKDAAAVRSAARSSSDMMEFIAARARLQAYEVEFKQSMAQAKIKPTDPNWNTKKAEFIKEKNAETKGGVDKDQDTIKKGVRGVAASSKVGAPVQLMGFGPNSLIQLYDLFMKISDDVDKRAKAKESTMLKNDKKAEEKLSGFIEDLLAFVALGLGGLGALWNEFSGTISKFSGTIRLMGKTLLQASAQFLIKTWEHVASFGSKLTGAISKALGSAGAGVSKWVQKITGFFSKIGKGVGSVLSKVGGAIGKFLMFPIKLLSNIGSKFVGLFSKSAGKMVSKIPGLLSGLVAKIGTKLFSVIRFVPIVGSLFDFYDAYNRISQGDFAGGSIAIVSGLVGLIPGLGWVLSLGLGLFNAFLDTQRDDKGKINPKAGVIASIMDSIGTFISTYKYQIPIISTFCYLADAVEAFKSGEIASGFVNIVKSMPLLGPILGDGLAMVLELFGADTATADSVTGEKKSGSGSFLAQMARKAIHKIAKTLDAVWPDWLWKPDWIGKNADDKEFDKSQADTAAKDKKISLEEEAKKAAKEAKLKEENAKKGKTTQKSSTVSSVAANDAANATQESVSAMSEKETAQKVSDEEVVKEAAEVKKKQEKTAIETHNNATKEALGEMSDDVVKSNDKVAHHTQNVHSSIEGLNKIVSDKLDIMISLLAAQAGGGSSVTNTNISMSNNDSFRNRAREVII